MRPSPSSPHLTLFASALGFVVVLLDVSVVNVALEQLRQTWGADIAALQWVVNAYTLVFAALLLTSGALGDRFGARRVFTAGFVVFTLASLGCGLAASLPALLGFRLLQGLGAALLVPNALAMLQRAFEDPVKRSRAVGSWSAAGAIALAAGPVVGGVLVAQFGWRSIFLINLPIGLLGIVLAQRFAAPEDVRPGRGFDGAGQVTAVVALAALAGALGLAAERGWGHALVWGGLGLAAVCGLLFIRIEARSAAPMLPLDLFHDKAFSTVSLCGVLVNFAYYGLLFAFSLFFQVQLRLSPEQTGWAFLPMTLTLMAANLAAGRLLPRLGPRRLMVAGLTLAALGYGLLMPLSLDTGPWQLGMPMLLAATGIALTVPTMTNVTLSAVAPARAGIASGVLNSARQVGGMLGVAVCGYLVRDAEPARFVQGMHWALGTAVALLAAGALLCAGYLEPDRRRARKLSAR